MKYFDLTHTFTSETPVFPGDPVVELNQIANITRDGFTDHQIKTGMHVGTHVDAPLHMIEGGKLVSEFPIEKFIGPGRLIDARGLSIVGEETLKAISIQKGDVILVMTGFSQNFSRKEYFRDYPEIGEGFAKTVIKLGVKMVGLDTPSPDRPPFKIHKLLLGQEILIIENLTNLESLIGVGEFEVLALPAKFQTEASPARVVAKIAY